MSIMRLCEYLEHVRINQCLEPKNAIADWRDYLHAAKTIDVDLTDNNQRKQKLCRGYFACGGLLQSKY